jgi:hypothetical protein
MRLILACLLLAASLCATAQPYRPIQPGSTGLWGDPARVGEGVTVMAQTLAGGPFVFAAIFVMHEGESLGYFAQGDAHAHCARNVCDFPVYRRHSVNGEPVAIGTLGLEVHGGDRMSWLLVIEDGDRAIVRDAVLRQSLNPVGSAIGVCDRVGGFGPHPPNAGEWCGQP